MEVKKYSIWRMVVRIQNFQATITFTAVQNPVKRDEPIVLECEDVNDALEQARAMLSTFGVETHTKRGDPDTVLFDSPDYFIGELRWNTASTYDTPSLAYHIHEFVPIPKEGRAKT